MLIEEHLLGDKRIQLRGHDDNVWTLVEQVILDMHGNVLFLVCRDEVIIPWHSIEQIAPLGR